MTKLALAAAGGLMIVAQYGMLPHGPAVVTLAGAAGVLLMIWIGLFART